MMYAMVDEDGNVMGYIRRDKKPSDEVKRIKREYKKRYTWANRTGYSPICYDCKHMKKDCTGTKNSVWNHCTRHERKT